MAVKSLQDAIEKGQRSYLRIKIIWLDTIVYYNNQNMTVFDVIDKYNDKMFIIKKYFPDSITREVYEIMGM
jgi:hypothetical protein